MPLPSPPPFVGEWLKLLIQVVKRPASFTPSLLPVLSTWALAHTYSKSLGLTSLQPRTKPLTRILTAYSICLTMDPIYTIHTNTNIFTYMTRIFVDRDLRSNRIKYVKFPLCFFSVSHFLFTFFLAAIPPLGDACGVSKERERQVCMVGRDNEASRFPWQD